MLYKVNVWYSVYDLLPLYGSLHEKLRRLNNHMVYILYFFNTYLTKHLFPSVHIFKKPWEYLKQTDIQYLLALNICSFLIPGLQTFEKIKRIQIQKWHEAKTEEEKSSIECNPLVIFHQAVENGRPLLQVTPIKRGGITYQVSVHFKNCLCPISLTQGFSLNHTIFFWTFHHYTSQCKFLLVVSLCGPWAWGLQF